MATYNRFEATINADRSITVGLAATNSASAGKSAFIYDDTLSRRDVQKALAAIGRAVSREFSKVVAAGDVPTTGSSVE